MTPPLDQIAIELACANVYLEMISDALKNLVGLVFVLCGIQALRVGLGR